MKLDSLDFDVNLARLKWKLLNDQSQINEYILSCETMAGNDFISLSDLAETIQGYFPSHSKRIAQKALQQIEFFDEQIYPTRFRSLTAIIRSN